MAGVDDARRPSTCSPGGRSAGARSCSPSRSSGSPPSSARSAAMYFTVLLSTDATYREEFADDVGPAVAPSSRRALRLPAGRRADRRSASVSRPRRSGCSTTAAEMRRVDRRCSTRCGDRPRRSSASSCCAPSATPAATCAAAYADEQVVGGSLGFLGRHDGPAVAAQPRHRHPARASAAPALGRAMKLHQRAWAADHGLAWVTWTFDPLVRRNAWFNIAVLGAEVHEYLVDFYGPMTTPSTPATRATACSSPGRVGDGPTDAAAGRHARAPSPCRPRRTSSCCGAPTRPAAAALAPPRARRARRRGSPPAAGSSASPATGDYVVGWTAP